MSIRFINNEPALFINDREHGKILVIADLHLGIEHELYKDGIVIAPQAVRLYKKIDNLLKMTKAEKLVIIGDLKHKIPGISFRELREIPKFIEPLTEKVDMFLAKGNHDAELKDLVEKVEVHGSKGFKIGPYGFFHGHAWPSKKLLKCDYLFTAHIHPTVEFVDEFGFRIVEKVWVKSELEEEILAEHYDVEEDKMGELKTIIFPSFNPIISGSPLNSDKKKSYIGPLLSNKVLNVEEAETYMLDGTELGKIGKI